MAKSSKPRAPRKARAPKPTPAPPAPQIAGLTWGDTISAPPLSWLISGLIPAGTLTLLEGRKAVGKTSVLASVAAHVSGGTTFPGAPHRHGRRVVWLAGEESWGRDVRPRLEAAGANVGWVGDLRTPLQGTETRRLLLPHDLDQLTRAVVAAEIELLVLDPYISAIAQGLDMRVERDVRAALEPLVELAAATGLTVLMSRHLRKGTGGDVREAGLGGVAVGNVARHIVRLDEHPHEAGVYCASVVASNCCSRELTRTYRIRVHANGAPFVDWQGTVALTADEIAEGRGSAAERDEWGDAERILYLSIRNRDVPWDEILAEAKRAGVTERTLRRAKTALGVSSKRCAHGREAHWEWCAPKKGWPDGLVRACEAEAKEQPRVTVNTFGGNGQG